MPTLLPPLMRFVFSSVGQFAVSKDRFVVHVRSSSQSSDQNPAKVRSLSTDPTTRLSCFVPEALGAAAVRGHCACVRVNKSEIGCIG